MNGVLPSRRPEIFPTLPPASNRAAEPSRIVSEVTRSAQPRRRGSESGLIVLLPIASPSASAVRAVAPTGPHDFFHVASLFPLHFLEPRLPRHKASRHPPREPCRELDQCIRRRNSPTMSRKIVSMRAHDDWHSNPAGSRILCRRSSPGCRPRTHTQPADTGFQPPDRVQQKYASLTTVFAGSNCDLRHVRREFVRDSSATPRSVRASWRQDQRLAFGM